MRLDHEQQMLAMYRAIVANILRNAPLTSTLELLIRGIEEQDDSLSAAILLFPEEDQTGEKTQFIVSGLHPECVQAIRRLSADPSELHADADSHEHLSQTLEQSLHWQQLTQIAEQFQLSARVVLPLLNSNETMFGMLFIFVPAAQTLSPEQHQLIAETARLAVMPVAHDRQQRKILTATLAARQSEASMSRMALAIEGSATGIWDRNIVTGEIHYSPGWKALLGYAEHEVTHHIEDSYQRVHPDDLASVRATMQAHFEGLTKQYVVEHRVRCKDGSYRWISSRGKVVSRDENGKPLRMIGTTTDITTMRMLSESLQESVDLVTCLTNEVPGLAYQYRLSADGDEYFSYVSEGVRDIYELTPEQMQMHDSVERIHSLIHADDLDQYRAAIMNSADALQHLHLEYRVSLPQQGLRWCQMVARPRRLPDGGTLWHGLITDVTEHKRIESELQEFATIDFLTQMPNRRYFMGRMEQELARIQRSNSKPCAVLMCDLDYFKVINDTYGHAVGDMVLKHFASILHSALRKSDAAGRVGGEEFAVILSGADLNDAQMFAQRIQKQLQDNPVKANHHLIPVTVSIGITMMTSDDLDVDAPLSRSDMALYRAKENGRNCFAITDV